MFDSHMPRRKKYLIVYTVIFFSGDVSLDGIITILCISYVAVYS